MADSKEKDASRPTSKTPEKRAAAKKTAAKKIEIELAHLRKGTRDSDSVRALQQALVKKVDKSLKPEVTGTYDGFTQRAVRAWQNENGFDGGRGLRLSEEQAARLFGDLVSFINDSS